MVRDITVNELLQKQQQQSLVLIDVRSPSEHKEGSIPGSINIPIFTDEERTEVGTLYKQVSQQAAKQRGLEIISAKLPDFVKEFQQINQEKIVYCWRGGMRSKTAATLVDLMGISVSRLEGGIRSYRNWVVETLESYHLKPITYALNGFTGSGKTLILQKLKQAGYPVIDLEGLAQHRGSIFGQIGLEPNNQRTFDALLLNELRQLQDAPFLLMEAESRRIGKARLPEFLTDKKEQGVQIFVDIPLEERVKNILDDYQPWNHHEEYLHAFQLIKRRIHTPVAAEIDKLLRQEAYTKAIQLLLEYYYDPRYLYAIEHFPSERTFYIKASNIDEATDRLKELVSSIPVK